MASDLDRYEPTSRGALAVLDDPFGGLTRAVKIGTSMPGRLFPSFAHEAEMVPHAGRQRAEHLIGFADVLDGYDLLRRATRESLERPAAIEMLVSLFDGFGVKADKGVLAGMLAVLEGDEIARATKLWQPADVSPAALALACRTLMATKTFTPKPAELLAACREAAASLGTAERNCDRLVDFVRRCDAVLLEFAPDQWRAPYLTSRFHPLLPRMLALHDRYPGGADSFYEAVEREMTAHLPALLRARYDDA